MKTALMTIALMALTAGGAMAAERVRDYGRDHGRGHHDRGGVSERERAAIARSAASLASLRVRIHADGRVTRFERWQLRAAESRHRALVARARHS